MNKIILSVSCTKQVQLLFTVVGCVVPHMFRTVAGFTLDSGVLADLHRKEERLELIDCVCMLSSD